MFKKLLFQGLIFFICVAPLFGEISYDDQGRKNKKTRVEADVPTEMDRNYDELLHQWASKGNEWTCDNMGNSPILCDDSVYIKRLYALPSRMELAYNPIVKQYIEMYAGRRRGQVSYMLGQGAYYYPMFEEALDREGLPIELKYLPVIESALNPIARSRVGATGLWQFMAATGKMYGLEVNSLVDERRDPIKSTDAAVKYLKDMYAIYKDWNLVIAAYNCGPGNVNKALRRSGGKRDYWEIYPYLPKETRGYVPAFIAATYIMSYYDEHNICPLNTDLPVLIDTIGINKMLHFRQVSDVLNMPMEEIRKLNPQFKNDIIPGEHKEYTLKLPIKNLTAFVEKEDIILKHRSSELLTHQRIREVASASDGTSASGGGGYSTYKVKKGDNLGAIAMRNRVSVAQLKNWNSLRSDNLAIGQMLKVSAYTAPIKIEKKERVANSPAKEQLRSEYKVEDGTLKKTILVKKPVVVDYKIQRGDNWSTIAKKEGVSVADVKGWNKNAGSKLVAGKVLKIHKTEMIEELVAVNKPREVKMNNASDALAFLDNYIEGMEFLPNTGASLIGSAENEDIEEFSESSDSVFTATYHNIVYGETLSQIASKYNVTVEDILLWNNITDESNSQVSRVLIVLPHDGKL